jgi:hypothetical protein
MHVVELCFHEADARLQSLASRGLSDAGAVVLRRPISAQRVLAPPAAGNATRLLLHTPALAALPAGHPALAEFAGPLLVAPVDGAWPLRASRPWLYAAPRGGRTLGRRELESAGFWKLTAWAAALKAADRKARIAAQIAIFRGFDRLRVGAPVLRRRRTLAEALSLAPLEQVSGARDWERAVTPLAVATTLAATALVSALVVDVATRPEAWGAIAQQDAPAEPRPVHAFRN